MAENSFLSAREYGRIFQATDDSTAKVFARSDALNVLPEGAFVNLLKHKNKPDEYAWYSVAPDKYLGINCDGPAYLVERLKL